MKFILPLLLTIINVVTVAGQDFAGVDTAMIKQRICMQGDTFDSLVNATKPQLDTAAVAVHLVSADEFAKVCKLSGKKRAIIYLWASWCHFSTENLSNAKRLNTTKDTVIFLSADVASSSQIKYIKKVCAYYNLRSTYLINSDFALQNPRDPGRVKKFLKPFHSSYDDGSPYYILLDSSKKKIAKEGYALADLKL